MTTKQLISATRTNGRRLRLSFLSTCTQLAPAGLKAVAANPTKLTSKGMTLVELLVVMVLASILVSTALPIISPNNDTRKIREASRAINSFLAAAQAKAIQTGRPHGVAFKRLSETTKNNDDAAACLELQAIEVPPHYTGFDENSVVRIALNEDYDPNDLNDHQPFLFQFVRRDNTIENGLVADLVPPSFLRNGDLIEVAGQMFQITGDSLGTDSKDYYPESTDEAIGNINRFYLAPVNFVPGTPLSELPTISPAYDKNNNELPSPEVMQAQSDDSSTNGDPPEALYWTTPCSYRITRQPIAGLGEPLQLPGGTAIDLGASGVDLNRLGISAVRFHNSENETGTPFLLFTPSGGVKAQVPGGTLTPITGSIALCVGRNDLIPHEPTDLATDRATSLREARDKPIDLKKDLPDIAGENAAETDEVREIMDKYNWLNMDSRWVVLSGRSGSVSTVANSYVNPKSKTTENDVFEIDEQLYKALSNAPSRASAGGR